MDKYVGFTGTRNGLTPGQKFELSEYLRYLKNQGFTHFRHGDCIGADSQAANLAKQMGYYLVAHPGHPHKDKNNTSYRAFTKFNDEVLEAKPFLTRDHDIVDLSQHMIATPNGEEKLRSGTWATIRYAKKVGKPLRIIRPKEKETPNFGLMYL